MYYFLAKKAIVNETAIVSKGSFVMSHDNDVEFQKITSKFEFCMKNRSK